MKSPRLTLHRVRKDGYLPRSTEGHWLILFRDSGKQVNSMEFFHHSASTTPNVSPFTHYILRPDKYDLAPVSPKRRKKS